MTQQTALEWLAGQVRTSVKRKDQTLDDITRLWMSTIPASVVEWIAADPRYLDYCKEQEFWESPAPDYIPTSVGATIMEQDRKGEKRPMPDWFKKWIPALEEARLHDAWNGPKGKQFRADNGLGEMEYPEYLRLVRDQMTEHTPPLIDFPSKSP